MPGELLTELGNRVEAGEAPASLQHPVCTSLHAAASSAACMDDAAPTGVSPRMASR